MATKLKPIGPDELLDAGGKTKAAVSLIDKGIVYMGGRKIFVGKCMYPFTVAGTVGYYV